MQNLTNNPESDDQPVWLSNHEIVFVSNMDGAYRQLYLLNLDDGSVENISNNDDFNHYPKVASQPQLLAYTTVKRTDNRHWSINVWDSANRTTTTVMSNTHSSCFDWSRTGDLVFLANLNGNYDIFVWDRSDGSTRNLTNNRADESCPNWLPDGRVAFEVDKQLYFLNPLTLSRQDGYPLQIGFLSTRTTAWSK
jgi:Tol biopolymer transport system component